MKAASAMAWGGQYIAQFGFRCLHHAYSFPAAFAQTPQYGTADEATTAPSAHSGPAPTPGTATRGEFAGLVDIGGRRLYLACKGSGTPTVILEAGAGNNGDIWSMVEPEAAA